MAYVDIARLGPGRAPLAWEGMSRRLDAARPIVARLQPDAVTRRHAGFVRQMLVAASMAAGAIVAVAAAMLLAAL